jgi:polysaccharide biosynthesis transport protein
LAEIKIGQKGWNVMSEDHYRIDSRQYPVPYGEKPPPYEEPVQRYLHYEAGPALNHYMEILFRRKSTILAFIAASFLIMTAVTFIQPWTYKGQASVEVTPSVPNVTKFAEVMTDHFQTDEFTRTETAIFQSSALASRVITKLELDKNPAFNPYIEKTNSGAISLVKRLFKNTAEKISLLVYGELDPSMVSLQHQAAMIDKFVNSLDVQSIPGTNIIKVAFSSTDRSLSRDATNETVSEFMYWQLDRLMDDIRSAKEQLEKQIAIARDELEKSQAQLDKFSKASGIVSLDSKSSLILQQLEQINQSLAKVEADRIAKEEQYDHAKDSDLSELSTVLQSNLIQQLKNQQVELMGEYEKLRVIYKKDYPVVLKLSAKIADTGRRIDLEQKRVLNSIKGDYSALKKTESAFQAAAIRKQALAQDYNEKSNNYKLLQSQLDTNQQIYTSLLQRSKEIDANAATEIGKVKLLSLALLPVMPYKPNIALNFLIALVLGTAGGVGLAFLREYTDRKLKRSSEVTELYPFRILGALPLVSRSEASNLPAKVLTNPDTIFSEAIRLMKTSIQLSNPVDNPIKSMLITSTDANAGKSTITANLAFAFASTVNEKVLVIDTDFSLCRLHEVFTGNGKKRQVGLHEYLSGQCNLEDIIYKTELLNLFFIPAGLKPSTSSQLLHSNEMKSLMQKLAGQFDRVLLDGRPFSSDSLALAKMVDAVILIAAIGGTDRESIQIFHQSISNVGANILGVIINKLQANRYSCDNYSNYYRSFSHQSHLEIMYKKMRKPAERTAIGSQIGPYG